MRVTVLGGFAALTSTGAGCSGYLIRHGETAIVADLGPGTLAELRRHVDVRTLSAIVISHGHLDHILDLGTLHHLLMYSPAPTSRTMPLFLPPYSSTQFDAWKRALYGGDDGNMLEDTFTVSEYDPTTEFTVGDITIRFAPTVHPLQAWAMRFSTTDHDSIGYTADTGPSASLDPLFDGVDALISEATLIKPDEPFDTRGHLTASEAGQLAHRAGTSTLVLTHRWEETDDTMLLDQAQQFFQGRIELARPGLTVDVLSSSN